MLNALAEACPGKYFCSTGAKFSKNWSWICSDSCTCSYLQPLFFWTWGRWQAGWRLSLTGLCPANGEIHCLDVCPVLQTRTMLSMWNWCATCSLHPFASLLSLFSQIFESVANLSWCLYPLFFCPLGIDRLHTGNKSLVLNFTSKPQNIFNVRWH